MTDERRAPLQVAGMVEAAPTQDLPRVLSVPAFAARAGRGRAWGYKAVKAGLVRAHRLLGAVVITEQDAQAFFRENLKPYAPERSWHPSVRKRSRARES